MDEYTMMTASRLRARAEHCRRIARAAHSAGIARELCLLAEEYETDAGRLELRPPLRSMGQPLRPRLS